MQRTHTQPTPNGGLDRGTRRRRVPEQFKLNLIENPQENGGSSFLASNRNNSHAKQAAACQLLRKILS